MAILVTGGTGFVGAELARILVSKGEDVVLFDVAPNYARINDIRDKVKVVQGNLANWSEVLNVVRDYNAEGICHLGGMLSVPSNANPWASFQVNVIGMVNVLEAARLFGAGEVIFTSSRRRGLSREQNCYSGTLDCPGCSLSWWHGLVCIEATQSAGLNIGLTRFKGQAFRACPLLFSLGPKAMVAAFLHLLATYQPDCYNL